MGERLKDKVAIVTGAGRGIGRGVALLMAEEGAKVAVNDLGGGPDGTGASASPADDVVAEIRSKGGTAVANYNSVATAEGGESIIRAALDSFGRLDILVNNAGILRDRMVFNMTEDEWDIVLKVHLYGHFYCTKPACVIFRQQRSGRIINISSASGLGSMGQANYSAAKEGIVGLTRTVARDMGRYSVTCNAIRPGAATRLTMTPELHEAWRRSGRTDLIEEMERQRPEDVAPFMVWLATDEAAGINGYDFSVRGGDIGLYSQPTVIKSIHKDGRWTVDELSAIVPRTLAVGLADPAQLQRPQ